MDVLFLLAWVAIAGTLAVIGYKLDIKPLLIAGVFMAIIAAGFDL